MIDFYRPDSLELRIISHPYMLDGFCALKLKCEVVYIGPLDAPIEDVECDEIIVSIKDYKQITSKLRSPTTPKGSAPAS